MDFHADDKFILGAGGGRSCDHDSTYQAQGRQSADCTDLHGLKNFTGRSAKTANPAQRGQYSHDSVVKMNGQIKDG
jgi:hypothetical protein